MCHEGRDLLSRITLFHAITTICTKQSGLLLPLITMNCPYDYFHTKCLFHMYINHPVHRTWRNCLRPARTWMKRAR